LRLGDEESDVGEGGGATRSDALGGERFEECAENVVDVELGHEVAGGWRVCGRDRNTILLIYYLLLNRAHWRSNRWDGISDIGDQISGDGDEGPALCRRRKG
jgi:hypothetical protein